MRNRILAAALVLTSTGCGDERRSPTSPSLPAGPGHTYFAVEAPASIPPGSSVQAKLFEVHPNGSRTDISSRAKKWTSSRPDDVQISDSGIATGIREGESDLVAEFDNRFANKVMYVLEPGTWSVFGTLTEGFQGLENARVEVISGVGTGKSATTNSGGWFKIYGVGGALQLRASANGFQSLTRDVTVASHTQIGTVALEAANPPLDVAGDWVLTIEAAGSCDTLPDIARRRTYTARIAQKGTGVNVTLGGADFRPEMNLFYGRIIDDGVVLRLTTYDYYGPFYDLAERIPPNLDYTVVGNATGRASTSSITTTLDGEIAVGPFAQVRSSCVSSSHRLTFVRSTAAHR